MVSTYNEHEFNKLILQCDYEDETKYISPNDMIVNNKKNYAYVTLVMLGDLYISAAIVLAESLKKLKTQADLVVLVTPDVTNKGKDILKMFFDHVIEISYIPIRNWRAKQQRFKKYLDYVFTKFHVFNLTQYKKILLIDADAIVLKYPDHLFTLNAPAGCYLKDKDLFITYDERGNYILPTDSKIKWYNEMCDCCGHGKLIDKKLTDVVTTTSCNPGIGGGLMLLEPKEGELDAIIKDITKGKSWELVSKIFPWPEQQYLTYRYSGKWTGMNPRFFGLQGYPHWKVLYGLQYGGDKPFMLSSKLPLEARLQYPDYILWHSIFREILDKNPKLKQEKSLEESIKMNSYYQQKQIIKLDMFPETNYHQQYIRFKKNYIQLKHKLSSS